MGMRIGGGRRAARPAIAGLVVVAVTGLNGASPAPAQEPSTPAQVRLAAPVDCLRNPGCGAGLRRVYGVDVTSVFSPLTTADTGIAALDDGLAEVAVAFSSDPQLSRPDIRSLRDDRGMIGSDHVVPVVRRRTLRRLGPRRAAELRRRINRASALIDTLALRRMNQQMADGRLAQPVGGEFVSANGLGDTGRRGGGRLVRVGYQDFAENAVLAHLYAEALRAGGFRARVVSVGGLRGEGLAALRRGRVDLVPEYAGSLRRHLGGRSLARAARARGLQPLRQAPGENRNVFAMRVDDAARLGITKLSDLRRYWPPAR